MTGLGKASTSKVHNVDQARWSIIANGSRGELNSYEKSSFQVWLVGRVGLAYAAFNVGSTPVQ